MEHITIGNSELETPPAATTVGAGISIDLGEHWDWSIYATLSNPPHREIICPVCQRQKSKNQTVCGVCYTNILDSRNGFYQDRVSKSEPTPISR